MVTENVFWGVHNIFYQVSFPKFMLISNSIHSPWMKVLTSLQTPQNTIALINLASLVDELYYIAFLFKFFIWLPLKLNTVNIYYQFLFSTFWILCSLSAFEIIPTFNLWNYGCFPFSVCMNCFYSMGSNSLSATLTVIMSPKCSVILILLLLLCIYILMEQRFWNTFYFVS